MAHRGTFESIKALSEKLVATIDLYERNNQIPPPSDTLYRSSDYLERALNALYDAIE